MLEHFKGQAPAANVLGESSSETSEEKNRLRYGVPAADSNVSHCNDANAAMHDPAYCARVADTSLGITYPFVFQSGAGQVLSWPHQGPDDPPDLSNWWHTSKARLYGPFLPEDAPKQIERVRAQLAK